MNFKISILSMFLLTLLGCNTKTKQEQLVEQVPVQVKIVRFEQAFFNTKPANLNRLKAQYPFFFPNQIDNTVWLEKIQNPQWRELFSEVQAQYKNFDTQQADIEMVFKHIKFYFPAVESPTVYTIIGEMDPSAKAIYANDKLIIALELYLGSTHRFYQDFPNYLKQNFEPNQILPDVVSSFAEQIVPPPTDQTFLSQMVYYGKKHYLKTILIPTVSESNQIGYTEQQTQWCKENESYMWQYFIEKKLLYSTDSHLLNQFINVAPFSKFYLEIDNESPGRVGQWLGWQIVQSFMTNNKSSVKQLLKLDAKTLFELSKYKPKKL